MRNPFRGHSRAGQLALEESRDLYGSLVATAPIGICIQQDDRFVFVNPEAIRIFGAHDAGQLIGRPIWDFVPEESREQLRSVIRGRYETGDEHRVETRLRRLDGTLIKLRSVGRRVKFEGRPALQVLMEDVTRERHAQAALAASEEALRSSEARFRAFVENIPASACLRDLSGRYVLANRTYEALHGPVATSPARATVHDFFPPEVAACLEAQDKDVIRLGTPVTTEIELPLRDGSSMTALIIKFPILDARGNVTMVGAIGTDISARKRGEEDLRAAKQAAEAANRAKTEFLANMSHELRTPLNSVLGFCQVMEQEIFGPLGNPKYREYVGDVLASGRSLLALIDDILDISRIEAGGMVLHPEWVEVSPVIMAAVRLVARDAEQKGLALGLEAAERLPMLHADERRVQQILVNLLSNAIKFTPPGGRVTVRSGVDGSGQLFVEVADTGIGIPRDKLDLALKVFGQLERPATMSREGAGLGLPLSKKLAALHHADLVIDSAPGRGTTVRVVFPRDRTAASAPLPLAVD